MRVGPPWCDRRPTTSGHGPPWQCCSARAAALHSIVDQLTEAEAELLAELLATRTAQAWDPGVASRAEAGLA